MSYIDSTRSLSTQFTQPTQPTFTDTQPSNDTKLQSQKLTSISNLQNKNNLDLFEDESRSISENEASENDEDQASSEDIKLTWRTTIQHWIVLVNEEISDDIDQDNYNIIFNIPTSEGVHPAYDQNSKWRLSELFSEG
ncbi:10531_t:CDS:2 [Funneliformis geosporum]|nr:10531_t:CDS:2 [Funneliformis geosporum]